jgi:hypothetical protein
MEEKLLTPLVTVFVILIACDVLPQVEHPDSLCVYRSAGAGRVIQDERQALGGLGQPMSPASCTCAVRSSACSFPLRELTAR